jgi:FHS family Na+ dependent glucose MFS transporter 1
VIGSMGFAEMAEKYSSHKLMAISFALVGLMAFLAVNTERVMMMAILFFLSGGACAGIDVLSQSSTVEVYGDKVDPWMQFLHFCFGMGAFISPLFLANMGGASYIVFGVASLILVVPSLWFKSPSIHKKTMKEDQNTN